MTAKHPTFIVSNGKGCSYFSRSIIPRDLRKIYNYPSELCISLKTGIKTEAKRLASILKYQLDIVFNDIRSEFITVTCVSSNKKLLKKIPW
jgi:hypothetical protein